MKIHGSAVAIIDICLTLQLVLVLKPVIENHFQQVGSLLFDLTHANNKITGTCL